MDLSTISITSDPVSESNFQPKPKRQGVKNYPASTFVTLYNELGSIDAVANRLNVSYTTVLRYLRAANVYESKRKPGKHVKHPLKLFVHLRCVEKLTLEEIAKRLDTSVKTVCKRLKQAGYNNLGKVRAPKRELYLSLQQQGLSIEEIATRCGVITETVRQMLLNYSGGAVGTRRMRPSAQRYIDLFRTGKTIREIATECGMAYVTVARSLRLHGVTRNGMTKCGNALPTPTFSAFVHREQIHLHNPLEELNG